MRDVVCCSMFWKKVEVLKYCLMKFHGTTVLNATCFLQYQCIRFIHDNRIAESVYSSLVENNIRVAILSSYSSRTGSRKSWNSLCWTLQRKRLSQSIQVLEIMIWILWFSSWFRNKLFATMSCRSNEKFLHSRMVYFFIWFRHGCAGF